MKFTQLTDKWKITNRLGYALIIIGNIDKKTIAPGENRDTINYLNIDPGKNIYY
jgi:hypothetical protein